jgi:basic membrane protein A
VAGSLGVTTAENSLKSKKSVTIGVDADFNLTAPKVKSAILISVLKGLNEAVQASIKEAYDGKYSNKQYVGTLKNKGVSLAPYHDLNSKVPAKMKSEILKIKNQIIDGTLKVNA